MGKHTKWAAVFATGVVVLGCVGGIGASALYWRSPPELHPKVRDLPAPIMAMERYGAVVDTHGRPYVYELTMDPGAVLVFGAEHIKDPKDASLQTLRERTRAFKPTVVLIEGRLGFHVGTVNGAIRKLGETAAARTLASTYGARLYTWEPDRATDVAMMLERFPQEQVALMYILRKYFSNYRFGKPDDPDAFVERTRRERTTWPGLEDSFDSVAEIDAAWQRLCPGLPDWRETSDEFGWPAPLASLADFNRDLRTTHLVRCVLDQCAKGERVLVVAGCSHAVRIDPTLRAASSGE
ncbi:MAG: hypothetical protein KDA20_09770 [Phycisphaerales bacterium]|nr:hypothetical protein [Phycisphaerales bacterium]